MHLFFNSVYLLVCENVELELTVSEFLIIHSLFYICWKHPWTAVIDVSLIVITILKYYSLYTMDLKLCFFSWCMIYPWAHF